MRTPWAARNSTSRSRSCSGGGRRFVGDDSGRPDAGRLARQDLRQRGADHPLPPIPAHKAVQRRCGDPHPPTTARQFVAADPLPAVGRRSRPERPDAPPAGSSRFAAAPRNAGSWSADFLFDKLSRAPMSSTWTRPVKCSASGAKKPGLAATNVHVCAARIVCLAGRPVSQSRPLGKSIAKVGAAAALIWSITASSGGRGSPRAPVPSRASTTKSAHANRSASRAGSCRSPKTSKGTPALQRI